MTSAPRVSVGLPVYNGEPFLEEALESILGQSYADFELVICDNASTDATEAICRARAERDERILYHRNPENRGAAWNYNRVFELSSGEYFRWMAHDDVCGRELLQRCVEALDADPCVVLAYPRVCRIDAQGATLGRPRWNLHDDVQQPHVRFRYQICIDHWCFHAFGMMRADVLRKTRLIERYVASDRVLLAHLALLGRFQELSEELFFHREHAQRSTRANATLQSRNAWFDPSREGRLTFPNWRLLREYSRIVGRVGLGVRERLLCRLQLLRWVRHYWRQLLADVGMAARGVR